jgi:DNA-binding CsgD family transcriptional regulator
VLYGRDAERDRIARMLEGARSSRSGALVVRGDPGVGKTALLEDTRDRAGDMQVLSARGIESESELPFAALHQLVWPALEHLGALPQPQARALRGALGLEDSTGQARFLVYSGCLTLLSELAERRPVLCLVDDAHWLDAASADALRFVARRIGAEGIVLLFGAREGDVRRFEADDLPSLMLAGLDEDAADALLTDAAVASSVVRERLVAHTQGNALALLELPGALSAEQLAGSEPLPDALPMTRQLESVFHARAALLPEETRQILLVLAADDSEDLRVITRAGSALGVDPYALDPAEQDGLVAIRGTRVVFRHPLVRSAVYGSAPSRERRRAHRALADALAGDDAQADRRAWHLAAAALEHDDDVVRELDQAARRAEERGGHAAAARALERAAELSLDPGERDRRRVLAARDLSLAGRDEQAVVMADQAGDVRDRPLLWAELARVRAACAIRRGSPASAVPELVGAATELSASDPAVAIELVIHAVVSAWQGGGATAWQEVTAIVETLPSDRLDETSRVLAGSVVGFAGMLQGKPDAVPLLQATAVWGATAEEPRLVMWSSWAALWLADMASFEALLERAAALCRARGELGMLADALGVRAVHLSLVCQRFREGAIAAEEAVGLGRELDAENILMLPQAALAVVAAVQGRDDEAREHAERVIDGARRKDVRLRATPAVAALALVDLGRSRAEEAYERLAALTDPADPGLGITAPDRIEAAVRAGRQAEARAGLEYYERWAGYSGAPQARPRLASCRGLVAQGEEATAHFEEAIGLIGDARPFDRPRIHLLAGEHLRREGRRIQAREHLRAAIEGFEALGAEPWAERARGELRASGETARKRDPGAVDALTGQELQIARLVAQGYTNKEVAAQLFLSPRTIDAHLRGVFGKLGITSRRALRDIPLEDAAAPALAAAT